MTRDNSKFAADSGREAKNGSKRLQFILGGVVVIALCGVIRHYWSAPPANADASRRSEAATSLSVRPSGTSADGADARESDPPARSASGQNRSEASIPAIVATVNTRRISREDLARDCLRHFGKEVLESMVNKRLIMLECHQQGIKVTRREVNDEIERMARRFKIPVEQWLKMLKQERNISAEQYADDIIWPTIALRKLAGTQVNVSEEKVREEYETQYGEQIRVRLIAAKDLQTAKDLRAQAVADPASFGDLAKKYSEDTASASVKGVINPIRKHGSYQQIEDAVFNIRDGDITQVIHAGGQYVFLQRVQAIQPQNVPTFDEAAPKLREFLRDRKMRSIAQDIFQKVQDRASKQHAVQNVWNDPAKRQRMPGVAATIYDDQITIRELAEECVTRHGQEVLEGTINRTLIELECKQQGIAITDDDIDREIEHMALSGIKTKSDGSPDVKAWLEVVTKQGVSVDVYRHDAVWPTVALKKLVGAVKVTEEDLKMGYEANYGQRVRCLAIVLNDERRAQQVFEMARKNNTSEYFGKLAAQYSVEPGSQALQGEVPPIRKYGGQPLLEKEAFQLQTGEVSGVIQVADKFVILRCEGRTQPVSRADFASVRDLLYRDLYEKKLQLAMTDRFESMQEAAVIDNFLANTTHSPKPSKGVQSSAHLPTLQQIPSR